MLLGTFVDDVWWPSCARLRECTRVGYESAYRCHIQSKWGGVDMESITASDIEEWLGSFKRAGAARKAWAVLRAILRLAYRRGVTDNDVTRREIRLPHLRRYEPRVLDARQVRRLLKGFYGHALEAWLLVSVCAGLRRCESVGIEWSDLDLKRGTVTVKRSVQWVAGHETVTDPEFTISGYVVNGLATVYCRWVNKGLFGNKAWNGVPLASMDVQSASEGFNEFVDNSYEDHMENRFLYVAGNTVSFRTSYDATIPANTWHVGNVSFPVATV